MPFTRNTLDEHLDMLMVCHHLSPACRRTSRSPTRASGRETIAAEDVLHDLGAISMMSSDSQAMGRIGEVICRTWQTADKMKRQRGPLRRRARPAQRQPARPALHREVHDQPGDHARHRARCRVDRGRQDGRSGAVEAGVLRRQAGAGHQGRLHRRRDDGRRQRVDPDAAAGHSRPMFGALRRRAPRHVASTSSVQAGLDGGALDGSGWPRPSRCAAAARSASRTWC